MGKLIIIPDVHGRKFWKKAITEMQNDDKVIFLGDYLDPYHYEGITNEEALENFKEILKFKEKHSEQVILLLGNHCTHYLNYQLNASRKWNTKYSELHDLYMDNLDLFDLIHVEQDYDKYLVFSHAGIHVEWLQHIFPVLGIDPVKPELITSEEFIKIIERLNKSFKETPHKLLQPLWRVSYVRGGYDDVGSCIWADLSEWITCPYLIANRGSKDFKELFINEVPAYQEIYQIFGHSQQRENPVINNIFACIDCRKIFTYSNNELKEL